MIELAIKIDNQLYKRRREQNNTQKWRQTGQKYYPKYKTNPSQGQSIVPRTNDDPYGPRPMDLDATRHKKITEEEKKRRLRDHLCLYCGNEGHTAWNCPNKRNLGKKNFNYQLRATQEVLVERTNPSNHNYQLRAIQEIQPSHETKKTMVATQLGKHLQLTAKIANHLATTLLDLGATGNFMDPYFQKKIGTLGELKAKPTLI
jgi:hypothetical protein